MLKKYWWLFLLIILAILLALFFSLRADKEPVICSQPLTPEDGVELPYNMDLVLFSFTATEGAALYHLNIDTPTGHLITFELEEPYANRHIPTFSMPGENTWYVDVLNENREVICTSENFTFTTIE